MLVKIFLCEEHYKKLKKNGPVKGSSRVWGTGRMGLCFATQCIRDIAWAVNVRLPEKNLVKKKDVK